MSCGVKRNFYAESMYNSADVEENAKVDMKFFHGTADYKVYEEKYKSGFNNVTDVNNAKTWQARKCWAIPNIALGILKTIGHLFLVVGFARIGAHKQVCEHAFSAVRDVEEIFGNFILLFNDKLGLFHIQKAQYQKYCYHEFGKLPKMRFNFNYNNFNFEDFLRNHNNQNTYSHPFVNFPSFEEKKKIEGYYKTLGLTDAASVEDIKNAYKKLSRIHHPDRIRIKDGESEVDFGNRVQSNKETFQKLVDARDALVKIKTNGKET